MEMEKNIMRREAKVCAINDEHFVRTVGDDR